MFQKIFDHFHYIAIQEISAGCVDDDGGVFRHLLQFGFHDWFVEERHIFPQTEEVLVVVVYDENGRPEIAPQYKKQSHQTTDKNAFHQIS